MSARMLWAIIVGFCIGVAIRSFVGIPPTIFIVSIGIAAAGLMSGIFVRTYSREVLLGSLAIVAAVGGVLRMDSATPPIHTLLAHQVNQEISLRGVIVREPDIREKSVRLTVETDEGSRVLVIAPAHTEVSYGDVVEIVGELQLPQSFESGEGRSFNYPMYLAKDGIQYVVAFADVTVVGHGEGNLPQAIAIGFKRAYIEGLQAVLPEPYAGLAGGITVGDKRSVGRELSEIFQRVSLVHILVLSGYNITIVLAGFARALSIVPRQARLALSAIVILFFILMSGGASSATRAGAMAFVGVYARQTGRLFFAVRILAVVGFLMVLWNPYVLAYDPGFQLSMLATLGLVLFTSIFASYLPWMTERFALREIAASTLATQVTVLPLLLYQNGLLSIVALPANLLALIAVPAAMAFSAIAAFAGIVFGSWGTLLAFPAYILLAYIVRVAELLAAIPFASVSIDAFSGWWLVPVYAALGIFVYIKRNRPRVVPPAERVTQ